MLPKAFSATLQARVPQRPPEHKPGANVSPSDDGKGRRENSASCLHPHPPSVLAGCLSPSRWDGGKGAVIALYLGQLEKQLSDQEKPKGRDQPQKLKDISLLSEHHLRYQFLISIYQ